MPRKKAAPASEAAPKIDAPPENPPAPAAAKAPKERKAAPAKLSTGNVDNSWKQLLIVAAFAAAGLWLVTRKAAKPAESVRAPAPVSRKPKETISAGAAISDFIARRGN